ncbi:hypothetical protein Vretimale_5540 [Volvox reticuliferus]|uniref:SBP-type domain-containing protein n=1 Tax=Volvox reticuliferus TaxID=1737510 RepID=A0A8J4G5N8_9CHLO|nr:hypothetical protein Vretifemale_5541 [Volvox reticuliferus]GIM00545.1 hypothetical protein Vretimale_5540 [Volvox reticuliferus]
MSGMRARRRVEEETHREEPWTLEDYEWDPLTCVARKKRIVASGAGASATDIAYNAPQQGFLEAALGGDIPQQTYPENPKFYSLPVLETVDRADADPATVCEVVGCGASLEGLKKYYVRMRVCERHLHAQAIVVNGVVSRFCQQCAKFQFLGDFSGNKKSCIATLERHNARHRAKVQARRLDDGDSDSGRSRKPRGRAKAGSSRKADQLEVTTTKSISGGSGGGAASPGAGDQTRRTHSDNSGTAMEEFWMPCHATAGQQPSGHSGGVKLTECGANYIDQPVFAPQANVQHIHSPGAPVLSVEGTAPSKPASPPPPASAWDCASSALLDRPPRRQVVTLGNAVVSVGQHAVPAMAGSGPSVAPQHMQQLALPPPVLMSSSAQPPWPQQQPCDVQRALAAVHGQLVMDGGVPGPPTDGGMRQQPWDHSQHAISGDTGIMGPHSQGADAAAANSGNTLGAFNDHYGFENDMCCGKASRATARQALQATTGGGGTAAGGIYFGAAGGAHAYEGFLPETTNSGGSRQSDVEPCSNFGRGATNAASPAFSADEGVSATRVSASGTGFADPAGSSGMQPQAGDVAARISSIMQELCPLIEQFKQEVVRGAVGESAFASTVGPGQSMGDGERPAAAVSGSPAGAMEAGFGSHAADRGAPRDRVGSSTLPPLIDTAMTMMQQASQLAASLQPRSTFTNPPWTVTSGNPHESRQPGFTSAGSQAPEAVQQPQDSGGPFVVHADGLPSNATLQLPTPGWRPLASNPGIVVNEAAARHAASYITTSASYPLPASAMAPFSGLQEPVKPPVPAEPLVAVSYSATSKVTTFSGSHDVSGGYSGFPAPGASGSACFGPTTRPSQLHPHVPPASTAGSGNGLAPAPVPVSAVEDSDDETFKQLLTLLRDDAGDATGTQPLFQGIAVTAQYAVDLHQQTVHAMPYGYKPESPFYWPMPHAATPAMPSQLAPLVAPQMAPLMPPPQVALAHDPHYRQPPMQPQLHASQSHLPMPPYTGWPAPLAPGAHVSVPHYVEEQDDLDPRELTRVSLKAMNVLPHELPPNMRNNLRRWLKEARAEALQATLRPGCLQLVVDVLRQPSTLEMSSLLIPDNDADQAAADVFRVLGQRLRDTYVQVDRKVLQMRVGERPVVLRWEEAAEDGGLDGAKYPALKGCSATAVCAGSQVVLQMNGCHLSQPGVKAYARLRGHDLRTTLLPAEAQPDATRSTTPMSGGSSVQISVVVPPHSVGLMIVDVGVGHLLGDWWPVLVLPPGCKGAAEEVRRLQVDMDALVQRTGLQGSGGEEVSDRSFRRLITDLANVVEVFSDVVAADAAAAGAAAAAAAAISNRSSSGGGGGQVTSGSPPEGRCPSPNGSSSHVSLSDTSLTAASMASWSFGGRTDTMSTNAGSTLGSFMTTSSALQSTPTGVAVGEAHAQALGLQRGVQTAAIGNPAAAAAVGAAGCVPAATPLASGAAAASPVTLLPSTSSIRQALSRAARLLRYAVARGLPNLTSLMLTIANRLVLVQRQLPQVQGQPPQRPEQSIQGGQAVAAAIAPSTCRGELLAAAGVDLQRLLPLAVLSGSSATVDQLMVFAAKMLHAPLKLDLPQCPGGLSVLHLAALLPDGGALACHLLATQPWAAWEWLSLGWTPPETLLEACRSRGQDHFDKQYPQHNASDTPGTVNSGGTVNTKEKATRSKGMDANGDGDDDDNDVMPRPAPPGPPRLTPGLLSVLLGSGATVQKAVLELVAMPSGGAAVTAPQRTGATPVALVGAVEAWARTGIVLLEALCDQLAQQKLVS